jgi:hypothetical protein
MEMDDREREYAAHIAQQRPGDVEASLRATLNALEYWKARAAVGALSPAEAEYVAVEEANARIQKVDLLRRGLPIPDWARPDSEKHGNGQVNREPCRGRKKTCSPRRNPAWV